MTVPPPNYPPPAPPPPPPPPPTAGGPGQPGPPGPAPRRPGRLVGVLCGLFYVIAVLVLSFVSDDLILSMVIGALFGIVGGTVAIADERSRPAATGFLIGLAIFSITLGGSCIGLIQMMGGFG